MINNYFKYAAAPVILLLAFGVFVLIYNLAGLPRDEELIDTVRGFFLKNLYLTIFLGALVEGLLVVNWYLPGSIVIVFGIVFARESGESAVFAVGLVIVAFL